MTKPITAKEITSDKMFFDAYSLSRYIDTHYELIPKEEPKMNISDLKNVGYMSDKFKELFGGMKFEKSEAKLQIKKLERNMLDKEILKEFQPEECTLGDLANALGTLDHESYIFYIRDSKNTLLAVNACWNADCGRWFVNAYAVDYPYGGYAGDRVVSRKCGNSDSGKLGTSEPKPKIENNGCPPHNMIPFNYQGTWSSSMPPPNMKCTKCLLEVRF